MGNQAGLMNPLLRWAPLAIGLTFFAAWEAASRLELISPLFFPAPTFVLETVLTMILDGELGIHVMATMTRVLAGFILGSALGLTLGMYMGWSRATRQVIDPLIAAIHPIPKISIFPLIMIVFGIGVLSKIVVVSVAAFFPMVINSMAGVRQIQPIYFDVARNYGASNWQIFTRVVLPGSLPMIFAGARLGLNLSLTITTAVELLMADTGLGSIIWLSWQTLRIEQLYAAVFTLAMIGISFRIVLALLADRIIPHHSRSSA
jgi:NitT/TauT family transport system permease protein